MKTFRTVCALLVVTAIVAQPAVACEGWLKDVGYEDSLYANWDGYEDLQVSGNMLYATAEGALSISTWNGDWGTPEDTSDETWIDFVLIVDNTTIYSHSIVESYDESNEISRDPINPDIVPIAWSYQLSSGAHTIQFYGMATSYGWFGLDTQKVVCLFHHTMQVNIP